MRRVVAARLRRVIAAAPRLLVFGAPRWGATTPRLCAATTRAAQ